MSKYFMGQTPLAEMEREMMEPRRGAGPPAFRGAVCCLRDKMCRRCREAQCRDNTYHRCPAEPKRTETLPYRELARRYFQGAVPTALGSGSPPKRTGCRHSPTPPARKYV